MNQALSLIYPRRLSRIPDPTLPDITFSTPGKHLLGAGIVIIRRRLHARSMKRFPEQDHLHAINYLLYARMASEEIP